jgi:hypothetical protein
MDDRRRQIMKSGLPTRSHFQLGLLTVMAMAGLACSSRALPGTKPADDNDVFSLTANWAAFSQGRSTEVDILFMVDNSLSMAPIQQQLSAGFEAFGRVLDELPGGTPDLHIGVVSSDMGAGTGIQACDGNGNAGVLQNSPRGSCTNTTLHGGERFIAVRTDPSTGQRITNYDASTLTEVFSCIANLGDTGCGFEQPLLSVMRALGADDYQPAENAGFLRRDAFLAVILITNEDDCSARSGAADGLFDTNQRTLETTLGPVGSFRCNEFGHRCPNGTGSLQAPSRYVAASYDGCESNEDSPYLTPVSGFVSALRRLKGDPAKVFVAAVAGPPSPYVVNLSEPTTADSGPWPAIEHSCEVAVADGAAPIYADPAIRVAEAAASFGRYGVFQSICSPGALIPLDRIAQQMTRPMDHPCVTAPTDTTACQVLDRWIEMDGTKVAEPVASCEATTGVAPCWRLIEDPAACGSNRRLQVERGGTAVPPGLMTAIDCSGQMP